MAAEQHLIARRRLAVGASLDAHVEGDGAVRLVARVEGMLGFTRGEAVSLLVDPQAVHLFDGNGRSLDG